MKIVDNRKNEEREKRNGMGLVIIKWRFSTMKYNSVCVCFKEKKGKI